MRTKRFLGVVLSAVMILSLFPLMSFAADGDMTYLYYDADSKTMKTGTKASGEYSVAQSSSSYYYSLGTAGKTTWYYANSSTTFTGRTSMLGDVHLVLADGVTLTFNYGISVNTSSSFTIYAQSEGSTAGALVAKATVAYNAAIGGGTKSDGTNPTDGSGTITINGGNITATGGSQGAGIGGGQKGYGGTITINGGNITAKGGTYAAGIGGGYGGSAGTITINGGVVNATGGEYNSTNGGSGIGNGNSASEGTVTINGGVVNATGGAKGAGIGGGINGSGCRVIVNGGIVNATAGSGATGIGMGYKGSSGGTFDTGTDGKGVVFATSISDSDYTDWTGIVFVGTSGRVYGTSVSPSESFEIPSGYTLTISSGQTVTIPEGVELSNIGTIVIEEGGSLIVNGTMEDNGTVTNNGTFTGNVTTGCTEHIYEDNGLCKYCGDYKPAELIADETSEHNGYYKIENTGHLMWFAEFVNSGNKDVNAVLTANIDMTDITDYIPIGQTASYHQSNATATDTGYTGIFDGNGFVIKNLSITGGSGSDILSYGIFGTVSGTVKKLGADNFTFNVGSADCRAGSIAGQVLAGGLITDCYAINSRVLTGIKIAGGVAGCNYSGTVKNCYAYNCTISAYGSRGGLVVGDSRADGGDTDRPGYVDNCYAANCTYTASDSGSYSNIVSTQSVSANVTKCAVLTAAQFASGEVAYLLNGESSDGVWGQNVTSGKYPVIGGAAVYKVKSGLCSASEEEMSTAYSNTNKNIITHNEVTETVNGICPNCGFYQAAVLTTDKYDIDGDNAIDSVYEISNAGQLYWFAEKVNSGGNNRFINGVLADNITVNQNLFTELITVSDDFTATVNGAKR